MLPKLSELKATAEKYILKPKISFIYVLHKRLTNETRDYYYYIQLQHQRMQDTNGLSFMPPPRLSLVPQSPDIASCLNQLKARTFLRASARTVPLPQSPDFPWCSTRLQHLNLISISIRSLFDLYLYSISIRSLYSISIRSLYSISI